MDQGEMFKQLFASRKRARIIKRFSRTLDSEELDSERVVDRKSGVVIERTVIQATTEHILIREFDPDANYDDAIELFIHDEDEEEKADE